VAPNLEEQVNHPADLRLLAFLLPQFHPIPENDEWWGNGFTEWFNVVRGRALFRGHVQPHLPADLGFYDLRLPETRQAQADLAARAGLHGFCYYHYWFEGDRLLQRPVDDLLQSGEPDFPFLLCWANENWTRVWTGGDRDILKRQTYSHRDDLEHIRFLSSVFADARYVRVDGRPVFLVYRPSSLPDVARTADIWRAEAQRLGIGELYLCAVHSNTTARVDPTTIGFDAAVQFQPDFGALSPRLYQHPARRAIRKWLRPTSPYRIHRVFDYPTLVEHQLAAPAPPYKQYPGVTPGFDNSARKTQGGAAILRGATPDAYERWLRGVVSSFEPYSRDENFVFVNAWNEWAEGNHLEPCQRWGTAFLDVHARLVQKQPIRATS
jgi:lipopolysaccharide biosynthesis protein